MIYNVNEIFSSIQGEGIDTGLPAVFVRMAGCNQTCKWCDTDYRHGTTMTEEEIAEVVKRMCKTFPEIFVVFTGGEPLLQNLYPVAELLKKSGYRLGLETNGTIGTDYTLWDSISCSPKVPRAKMSLEWCTSLKIVFPYMPEISAESFHFFPAKWKGLQPIDPGRNDSLRKEIILSTIQEVERLGAPWRISPQMHKLLELK